MAVDDLGRSSDRLGQCKSLTKLNISFTQVTDRGIRMALENLPNLKVFDCCSSVQVLSEMHRTAWENNLPDVGRYSLIDLYCLESFVPYQSGSLAVAVSLCCSVIKVSLVTQEGLTDCDLLALLSLRHLQEFSLSAGEVCRVSFNNGVWPVLQAHGQSLRILTIAELPGVNIRAITEFCPQLQSLHLVMNPSFDQFWPQEPKQLLKGSQPVKQPAQLNRLESLHLVCQLHVEESTNVPADQLTNLLSSAALSRVYIRECCSLTDDVLRAAFQRHRMPNLSHFELHQCNRLTDQAVQLLLTSGNPLSKLHLWQCQLLTRKHAAHWKSQAAKNKWQLSVEWS